LHITLLSIGKTKEPWLINALDLYIDRLKPYTEITCTFVKTEKQLIKEAEKHPHKILLDEKGASFSSTKFSEVVMQELIKGGAKLCFIIGGDSGLPHELLENKTILSLSKMTFTHQMVRCILLEQIYRAFEIAKGSKYHR
jgi:23S rRNA (pseudouridine1915-N3)-methyltransferase